MTKEVSNQSLSITDRIVLLGLIPNEGNMIKLMMFKDIVAKIELSNTEVKEINLTANDKWGLTRDVKKAKEKLVEFSLAEKEFIKWVLTKLDTEEKLTKDHIGLYNLFVK